MMSGRSGGSSRSGSQMRIKPPGSLLKSSQASLKMSRTNNKAEAIWPELEKAIYAIHRKESSNLVFEEIYRMVYTITIKGKGDYLAENIRRLEINWFKTEIIPQLRTRLPDNICEYVFKPGMNSEEQREFGNLTLATIRDIWLDYRQCISMVSDICMYLDRNATRDADKAATLDITIGLFRDHVFRGLVENYTACDIMKRIILNEIRRERLGGVVDRLLLKSAITLFSSLVQNEQDKMSPNLYHEVLLPEIISESEQYYTELCCQLLEAGDVPAWISSCFDCIAAELGRCQTYLPIDTAPLLRNVIDGRLIKSHIHQFVAMKDSGLSAMISRREFHSVRDLYNLEGSVDENNTQFNQGIQDKVFEKGIEMQNQLDKEFSQSLKLKDTDNDGLSEKKQHIAANQRTSVAIGWVEKIMALENDFAVIVDECCKGNVRVAAEVGKGFSRFINNHPRATEFLSVYIDEIFRRVSGNDDADSEIEGMATQIVRLIRYLQQKDEFQAYYHKHLARRILLGKNEGQLDLEQHLISRMKQELGSAFTKDFEKMLKDITLSSEITNGYANSLHAAKNTTGIDISVTVLTNGSWPIEVLGATNRSASDKENTSEDALAAEWPKDVKPAIDSISAYYNSLHESRSLRWCAAVGSADIKCKFPAIPGKSGMLGRERRYELNVSIWGMRVLVLFNNPDAATEGLTFDQIREKTKIAGMELARTLMALSVSPKCRVLTKDPPTKNIKGTDVFKFNREFVSKTIKIKARPPMMGTPAKVENDSERKASDRKQTEQRGYQIDAAVVRIMKQRKELQYSSLISEVIKQLVNQFSPEVSQIKKQIETLMDKEYIERVEGADVPTYRYMA